MPILSALSLVSRLMLLSVLVATPLSSFPSPPSAAPAESPSCRFTISFKNLSFIRTSVSRLSEVSLSRLSEVSGLNAVPLLRPYILIISTLIFQKKLKLLLILNFISVCRHHSLNLFHRGNFWHKVQIPSIVLLCHCVLRHLS